MKKREVYSIYQQQILFYMAQGYVLDPIVSDSISGYNGASVLEKNGEYIAVLFKRFGTKITIESIKMDASRIGHLINPLGGCTYPLYARVLYAVSNDWFVESDEFSLIESKRMRRAKNNDFTIYFHPQRGVFETVGVEKHKNTVYNTYHVYRENETLRQIAKKIAKKNHKRITKDTRIIVTKNVGIDGKRTHTQFCYGTKNGYYYINI